MALSFHLPSNFSTISSLFFSSEKQENYIIKPYLPIFSLLLSMATTWPQNKLPIFHKEKVVKELVEGQEYAVQLHNLLKKSYRVETSLISSSCDDLVLKTLTSFTNAISLLSSPAVSESVEVCENLATSQVDSVCCGDRRSQDSGQSRKRPVITAKERRGCYKRKKSSNSWTKVSPVIEDGHAWRKYGQKEILNATYPRSYFRCTHKYDKGCKATKQVQRTEDDPNKYLITYFGNHSCPNFIQIPHIFSTDSNNPQFRPTIKEEIPTRNLSSWDSIPWKNSLSFDQTVPEQPISHSLDMEPVLKSINFEFDETEFNYLI